MLLLAVMFEKCCLDLGASWGVALLANERISILKGTTFLTVLLYTTPNIFYPRLNRHDIIMHAKSPQLCPSL